MSSPSLSASPSTIVLLSHGPAAVTLTAIRRLEDITSDTETRIVVVAGTEPGLTAVDRAIDRGVDGVADHGPDALQSAVSRGDGIVAVVHDDCVVTGAHLKSLHAAHVDSELVAVAPATLGLRDETIEHAPLTCAVGTVVQLRALAARGAFGPGVIADGPFVAPSGVAVPHESTCQQRLVDPTNRAAPLLVAALIVRDESEHLAACLDSLDGLVDRVELCDTGSFDDTVAIARERGANVTEIGWRDDFAWARNQVRERCLDATYMLWIDADERLVCEDREHLRQVLATNDRLHASFRFAIHNLDSTGARTHSFLARRIVDPTAVRFVGAIHEQPVRLDGHRLHDATLAGLAIDHFGYEDAVVAQRNKADRNLRIARLSFEESADGTTALHLARALGAASQDPVETLRELDELRDLVLGESEAAQALFHSLRAELHLAADDLDAAIDVATRALDLIPADATAGAVLAEALTRSGRLDDVLSTAASYAKLSSPRPLVDDQLARGTRSRLLFEAAIHLGRSDTAVAQLDDLPDALDPWPVLAGQLDTSSFIDCAEGAAAAGDHRYLRALTSRPDLTSTALATCRSAFAAALPPEVTILLDTVAERLATADAAPTALATFERSGLEHDAVDYARQVVAGQADLTLELNHSDPADHPIAHAFAVAAEGQRRRGDIDVAATSARRAIGYWPAAGRAVDVLASAALDSADPAGALALLDAARDDPDYDRNTPPVRRGLASLRTRALLAKGDLRGAVSCAVDVLDLDGEIPAWEQFLAQTEDDLEALSLIIGLVLLTDGVSFIDALPQAVGPERTAMICATYLGMGGLNPEAVSVGVLAAAMTGQIDLGCLIASHAHLLPDDIIVRLSEHLDRTDTARIAVALASAERLTA